MTLQTQDYSLDGEVWTIRLYQESTYSETGQRQGAYLFEVEFRDVCWDSALTPARFTQTEYVFDLWFG